GNFRLICWFDANGNSTFDDGEQLRVLLFAVVKVSSVTDCTIDSPMPGFTGRVPDPNDSTMFGVETSAPMSLNCTVVVEGGGSDKKIGTSKINFGDVGNLTGDGATVTYATSGT